MRKFFLALSIAAVGLLVFSCASTPEGGAAPAAPVNLAYGKFTKSNNHILDFTSDRANDGDVLSYWEGAANSYPNDYTLDLGKVETLGKLVVKLNPKRIWQPRTQKIEILTSQDGNTFTSLIPATDYDFDPIDSDNSVSIPVTAKTEFVLLRFSSNTEATAGQMAELEAYAP